MMFAIFTAFVVVGASSTTLTHTVTHTVSPVPVATAVISPVADTDRLGFTFGVDTALTREEAMDIITDYSLRLSIPVTKCLRVLPSSSSSNTATTVCGTTTPAPPPVPTTTSTVSDSLSVSATLTSPTKAPTLTATNTPSFTGSHTPTQTPTLTRTPTPETANTGARSALVSRYIGTMPRSRVAKSAAAAGTFVMVSSTNVVLYSDGKFCLASTCVFLYTLWFDDLSVGETLSVNTIGLSSLSLTLQWYNVVSQPSVRAVTASDLAAIAPVAVTVSPTDDSDSLSFPLWWLWWIVPAFVVVVCVALLLGYCCGRSTKRNVTVKPVRLA